MAKNLGKYIYIYIYICFLVTTGGVLLDENMFGTLSDKEYALTIGDQTNVQQG